VKDLFSQEELYKDRDGQIAAIQKTFEDAKTDINKHHSKPNVYPIDVLPVYPDMKVCFKVDTFPVCLLKISGETRRVTTSFPLQMVTR